MSANRRTALVTLLAVHSGMTDAIGFVALGGAFTSVMTGNMVLVGIDITRGSVTAVLRTAVAVLVFVGGCAVGARIAGLGPHQVRPLQIWPEDVTRALRVQAALTVIFALGWWATGDGRGASAQLFLLAVNALCLGIQSSAVQRFGIAGLSTTYLTGTLTTVAIHLSTGQRGEEVSRSVRILVGLITGAAVGALLALHATALVPVGPLLALGTVLILSGLSRKFVGG